MDQQLITQKLESLRRCLRRVEDKAPQDPQKLINDPDLQDIVVLNLTRAVQLCVDIASHLISTSEEAAPSTMGESFELLAKLSILDEQTASMMKRAVGFRNIAVHDYEDIDWAIVHAICTKHLQDFKRFTKLVIRYTEKPS